MSETINLLDTHPPSFTPPNPSKFKLDLNPLVEVVKKVDFCSDIRFKTNQSTGSLSRLKKTSSSGNILRDENGKPIDFNPLGDRNDSVIRNLDQNLLDKYENSNTCNLPLTSNYSGESHDLANSPNSANISNIQTINNDGVFMTSSLTLGHENQDREYHATNPPLNYRHRESIYEMDGNQNMVGTVMQRSTSKTRVEGNEDRETACPTSPKQSRFEKFTQGLMFSSSRKNARNNLKDSSSKGSSTRPNDRSQAHSLMQANLAREAEKNRVRTGQNSLLSSVHGDIDEIDE